MFPILIGEIYADGPHRLRFKPNEVEPVPSPVVAMLHGPVALVEQALEDRRQLRSISRVDSQVQIAGQLVRKRLPRMQHAVENSVLVKQPEEQAEKMREAVALSRILNWGLVSLSNIHVPGARVYLFRHRFHPQGLDISDPFLREAVAGEIADCRSPIDEWPKNEIRKSKLENQPAATGQFSVGGVPYFKLA